jgi:hypothetical protein
MFLFPLIKVKMQKFIRNLSSRRFKKLTPNQKYLFGDKSFYADEEEKSKVKGKLKQSEFKTSKSNLKKRRKSFSEFLIQDLDSSEDKVN